jgi:hypothetical protein
MLGFRIRSTFQLATVSFIIISLSSGIHKKGSTIMDTSVASIAGQREIHRIRFFSFMSPALTLE